MELRGRGTVLLDGKVSVRVWGGRVVLLLRRAGTVLVLSGIWARNNRFVPRASRMPFPYALLAVVVGWDEVLLLLH